MNMNLDIVNGARYAAGLIKDDEESLGLLSKEDKNSGDPKRKEHFEVCKNLYLKTFLEAVSEVPWTMGRKRKRLLRTTLPHGNSGFKFTYNIPYDCARPVELSDKGTYVIDGDFLCTDSVRAELLYVSNGKRIPLDTEFEEVSVADFAAGNYDMVLSPGHLDDWDLPADFTVSMSIEEFAEENPEPMELEKEDWMDYKPPEYEPKFYEYFEMMLAAKLAINNTAQARLHDTLLQKALLIKRDAVKSTKSITANKDTPSKPWAERLGINMGF
jgi:hypothetical protein